MLARAHPENETVKAPRGTVPKIVLAHDRLAFIRSMGPGETDLLAAIATTVELLRRVDRCVCAVGHVFVLGVMDDDDRRRQRALTQNTVH